MPPHHAVMTACPDLAYPFHDHDVLVTACGRLCLHRSACDICDHVAGQRLGVKEVDDGIRLTSSVAVVLATSTSSRNSAPLDDRSAPRLLTHV